MFYVYEWHIIKTGEIIYVGKGTRRRYKVRKHNKFFNYMIQTQNCESRIVKEFIDEKSAFEFEYELIKELKGKNQCRCNIIDGGTGGTTSWWTQDRRNEYSIKNVMYSENQRKRMSVNNPMKNKEIANKVNQKNSKPVIVDNVLYKSKKQLADKYGVSPSSITFWIKRGYTRDNKPCCFLKDFKNASQYDNQQPSQAKTNNSNLEGSTTNG